MGRFFAILGLAFFAVFAVGWGAAARWPEILIEYQKNARSPLFTGFLTLGSFLLTLKTAILQRLKEGFDSQECLRLYRATRPSTETKPYHAPYYGALSNMSIALAAAVVLSLSSSASQMVFGFLPLHWAFGICVALPATALGLVLYLWYQITRAHRNWIKLIEERKATELNEAEAKRQKDEATLEEESRRKAEQASAKQAQGPAAG